jgi:hypothetical protein
MVMDFLEHPDQGIADAELPNLRAVLKDGGCDKRSQARRV